jgi:hypothetical protein
MGEYKRDENGEYDLWMKELLGEKGYRNLKIRANTTKKRDDKLDKLVIQSLIKESE